MMKHLRTGLAVLAGLVVGGLVTALVEWASIAVHPMPEGLDVTDRQALQRWIETLPSGAFWLVLCGWLLGTAAGCATARWFSPGRSLVASLIVGLLFTAATVFNLMTLPHPTWMIPVGLLSCLCGCVLGILLAAPGSYSFTTARYVHAPVEMVFETIAHPTRFAEAVEGIQHVELLSDQTSGPGTRFRETRQIDRRTAEMVLEIIECVENDHVRIAGEAAGVHWDTQLAVRQAGDVAKLTLTSHAVPHTILARILTPIMLAKVHQCLEEDMDAVKRFCEAKQ